MNRDQRKYLKSALDKLKQEFNSRLSKTLSKTPASKLAVKLGNQARDLNQKVWGTRCRLRDEFDDRATAITAEIMVGDPKAAYRLLTELKKVTVKFTDADRKALGMKSKPKGGVR